MPRPQKKRSAALKAKGSIAAIKGLKTVNQLAAEFDVHPSQIAKWKKVALEGLPSLFEIGRRTPDTAHEQKLSDLYEQIGRMKVELDWIKKSLEFPTEVHRGWISPCGELSISRQCELAGVSRATYYRAPASESEENLELMKRIDQIYTDYPFYGTRKIVAVLASEGLVVNRKRIQRLMRRMGIQALYPKPKTSGRGLEGTRFPYLLRNVEINRCDQVWSSDITYIKIRQGFIYLTAVIDWFSRLVLSWEISNTLDSSFCVSCLESALVNGKPEIFNSDQGSQYTSDDFVRVLRESDIKISMYGRRRWADNIFIERLWRTLKYEDVYLRDYDDVPDAVQSLARYFIFYNTKRPHQALGYRTPLDFYVEHAGRQQPGGPLKS